MGFTFSFHIDPCATSSGRWSGPGRNPFDNAIDTDSSRFDCQIHRRALNYADRHTPLPPRQRQRRFPHRSWSHRAPPKRPGLSTWNACWGFYFCFSGIQPESLSRLFIGSRSLKTRKWHLLVSGRIQTDCLWSDTGTAPSHTHCCAAGY